MKFERENKLEEQQKRTSFKSEKKKKQEKFERENEPEKQQQNVLQI